VLASGMQQLLLLLLLLPMREQRHFVSSRVLHCWQMVKHVVLPQPKFC
jgi:hypothetical protein